MPLSVLILIFCDHKFLFFDKKVLFFYFDGYGQHESLQTTTHDEGKNTKIVQEEGKLTVSTYI